MGTLQLVKSVTPQEVRLKSADFDEGETVNSVYCEAKRDCTTPPNTREVIQTSYPTGSKDCTYNPIDDLDLSGLTRQQQVGVRQMLDEEKDIFSRSDDDILVAWRNLS